MPKKKTPSIAVVQQQDGTLLRYALNRSARTPGMKHNMKPLIGPQSERRAKLLAKRAPRASA